MGHRLGTGGSTDMNDSPTASYRNTDLKLDSNGFRSNKESKDIVSDMCKTGICNKFRCNMEPQASEERTKV